MTAQDFIKRLLPAPGTPIDRTFKAGAALLFMAPTLAGDERTPTASLSPTQPAIISTPTPTPLAVSTITPLCDQPSPPIAIDRFDICQEDVCRATRLTAIHTLQQAVSLEPTLLGDVPFDHLVAGMLLALAIESNSGKKIHNKFGFDGPLQAKVDSGHFASTFDLHDDHRYIVEIVASILNKFPDLTFNIPAHEVQHIQGKPPITSIKASDLKASDIHTYPSIFERTETQVVAYALLQEKFYDIFQSRYGVDLKTWEPAKAALPNYVMYNDPRPAREVVQRVCKKAPMSELVIDAVTDDNPEDFKNLNALGVDIVAFLQSRKTAKNFVEDHILKAYPPTIIDKSKKKHRSPEIQKLINDNREGAIKFLTVARRTEYMMRVNSIIYGEQAERTPQQMMEALAAITSAQFFTAAAELSDDSKLTSFMSRTALDLRKLSRDVVIREPKLASPQPSPSPLALPLRAPG